MEEYGVDPSPASIGDFVWFDSNRNGLQDPAEPGIPGVTAHLLYSDGNPVLDPATNMPVTTVTGPNGEYEFTDLLPNTAYKARFDATTADTSGLPGPVTPAQLTPTSQRAGADPTTDSDPDPTTSIADTPTDAPDTNNPTYDAGYLAPPATIGDVI